MIETMATAAESVERPQDVVVRREVKRRPDWAKVGAEQYPALRGREGERIRISWKEEDVQLLDA